MLKTAVPHDGASVHEDLPGPEEIRSQLQIILESPAFHASKRSRQFLEYVCEKSLSGEVGALKERTLAVEVFGRSPHSDLGEDTIVRVGAREVRKRLAQFYVLPEGAACKVRIDLPPGSYAPEFRYAAAKHDLGPPAPPPPPLIAEQGSPRRMRPMAVVLAISLTGALILSMVKWTAVSPDAQLFANFWRPVLETPGPLLLAVGHPIVYHASARAVRKSEDRMPPQAIPLQRPIRLAPNEMDGSDMVSVLNQYVGFGDMVVSTQVAGMLGRRSKDVRTRFANTVEFADLRQSQTLLIGAFTNRWTMELGQHWRFQFARTPDRRAVIVDTQETGRQWGFALRDDGSASEDYTLVSRIPNSSVGGLLIIAAGVKQFGTEAAGRLLTDPAQLGGVLRKLPARWESRNIQIVLKTMVIGNTPAQPELVAWHVW